MNNNVLTSVGKVNLEKKLNKLNRDRSIMVKKLDEARRMGDLAENSAYHELKNQVQILDSQIEDLQNTLDSAVVTDSVTKEGIWIGSKIKLRQEEKEKEIELVGSGEADPLQGKISFNSPLGQALVYKKKGEKVVVKTPNGEIEYTILDVA
jgi:transcription elongation factor GreA